jgi:formylglycine-generating enzyme required for sulfatase activity
LRLSGFVALSAAALVLAGCGKDTSSSGGAASARSGGSPAATSPAAAEIVSKSGVHMAAIPGGTFTMGSDHGNPDEAPAHKVTVSAFAMDVYPVTHEMFAKAQIPDPSHWQDNPKGPVERVRWRDAKAYCNERSRLEGLKPCYDEKTPDWTCDYSATGYRLPTEAEWEYAARAGSDDPGPSTADALRQVAWFADDSDQKTHPVGQKKANPWGLYDMFGNVSVWCEDVYDPGYYKASPAADPHGPASPGRDVKRILRGGNWKASADMCSVTRRQGERTGDTDACFATDYCGMRCVRRLSADEAAKVGTPKGKG